MPDGWAFRSDIGLYEYTNGAEFTGTMEQIRGYTSVRPEEGQADLVYALDWSNIGYADEFQDAVNVRYTTVRATLNGKVLAEQTGGPYGARIGYLMNAIRFRHGEVMTIVFEGNGVPIMRAQCVAQPVEVNGVTAWVFVEYV